MRVSGKQAYRGSLFYTDKEKFHEIREKERERDREKEREREIQLQVETCITVTSARGIVFPAAFMPKNDYSR